MNYASRVLLTWRDGVSESMLHHDLFVCNAIAVVVYTTRAESKLPSYNLKQIEMDDVWKNKGIETTTLAPEECQ